MMLKSIVIAAVMLTIGSMMSMNAYATSVEAVGSPYNIADTGEFKICVDSDTTITKAKLFKPDETQAWETATGFSLTIPANSCDTILPGTLGFAGFDQLGTWVFVADTEGGIPFVYEFAVSFFVLPETALGAVAIIGSSMAVLAAFITLRNRRH